MAHRSCTSVGTFRLAAIIAGLVCAPAIVFAQRGTPQSSAATPDTIRQVVAPKIEQIEKSLGSALSQIQKFDKDVRSAETDSAEEVLAQTQDLRKNLMSSLNSAIQEQQAVESQAAAKYPGVENNEDYAALRAALADLQLITSDWEQKLSHPEYVEHKSKVIADIQIVGELTQYALREAREFNKSAGVGTS